MESLEDKVRRVTAEVLDIVDYDPAWPARAHPETAAQYATLKRRLAAEFTGDRVHYTEEKTSFIAEVTERAKFACQNPTSASA